MLQYSFPGGNGRVQLLLNILPIVFKYNPTWLIVNNSKKSVFISVPTFDLIDRDFCHSNLECHVQQKLLSVSVPFSLHLFSVQIPFDLP